MGISKEWLEEMLAYVEEGSRSALNPVVRAHKNLLASAFRELLARRAADEGAVVVEGWIRHSLTSDILKTPPLYVSEFPETRASIPITVTIRRRSAETAGESEKS